MGQCPDAPNSKISIYESPSIRIYADYGTEIYVLKRKEQFIEDLVELLQPNLRLSRKDVGYINAKQILQSDEWMSTTKILIMPGGFDKGYCAKLSVSGNDRIRAFVECHGGRYLGFCAGAYYASGKCVFNMFNYDNEKDSIVEDRELKFFPGEARGPFLGPYWYGSQQGSRAARLLMNPSLLNHTEFDDKPVHVYYNGGLEFVDADRYPDVNVLAHYDLQQPSSPTTSTIVATTATASRDARQKILSNPTAPAIVEMEIGKGRVILSGVHPEITTKYLHNQLQRLLQDPQKVSEARHLEENVVPLLKDERYQVLLRYLVGRLWTNMPEETNEKLSKL